MSYYKKHHVKFQVKTLSLVKLNIKKEGCPSYMPAFVAMNCFNIGLA